MKYRKEIISTAISTALAIAASGFASSAYAAHENEEQCAGIIKAGKNDCATSKNQCHGHVTSDAAPQAWIYVPKGTCDRLVGAHLVSVVDPTPNK